MHKTIRIGTRSSQLAMWQANTVAEKLNALGHAAEIVPMKSQGDIVLDKPLYEIGIVGVFTKTLDLALLNDEIDIAVHSMKDVPTGLPKGIVEAAVLERASPYDVLVYNGNLDFLNAEAVIATSSLRRTAQWLNRYPNHRIENLRGNINTRLQKTRKNQWNGAIFAAAGLERLDLLPAPYKMLEWMIPAPAQGAIMVVSREDDELLKETLSHINHKKSQIETQIERQFLKTLEGGCSAPIGALARYDEEKQHISFHGILLSLDGREKVEINKSFSMGTENINGADFAKTLLAEGGEELMREYREKRKR